jgi:hypothetical protein
VLRSDYRSAIQDFRSRKLGTPAPAEHPRRHCVGEIVRTKVSRLSNIIGLWLVAIGLLSMSGCGSSSSANVVTVSVGSSVGTTLILGQSTTITATVSGATNTNVNWPTVCQFTTTTTATSGTSTTTTKPADCPSDGTLGTLSNAQASGTITYLAPSTIPNQTTYPGLQIIVTATSQQDTKKTGSVTLTLDSGVFVSLTPGTAAVPTNEPQQFNVQLTNDLKAQGVTWLITQQTPNSTNPPTPVAQLKTCSPTCGTISSSTLTNATYAAPSTVPTSITPADPNNKNSPADLTIVAISAADNTRVASATITVFQGGPITFNGISPTIAPRNAAFWDIYLDAPNISSASTITLNYASGGAIPKKSDSGQIKILFGIPVTTTTNGVTTVTNPQSTGARIRLSASDLATVNGATPDAVTISVTDPGQTVTAPNPASAYTFKILPVRPTTVASVPDNIVQTNNASQQTQVIIDGGYFGPGDKANTSVSFLNTSILQDATVPSTARQLNTRLNTNQVSNVPPGLYPLSVSGSSKPDPFFNNPSITNIALFPDFSVTPPVVATSGIPAGTNPSAIDIDPTLGILAVADPGSSTVMFFSIVPPAQGTAAKLNLLSTVSNTAQAPLNFPTDLSINPNNHTVAVVNYGIQPVDGSGKVLAPSGQSVTVLPIPTAPGPQITPFSVDLSGIFQGSVSPAPMPYSIGVDPDSNLALVAYSSTTIVSASNLGIIVNLNPDSPSSPANQCVLDEAIHKSSGKRGQCLFSQVTLNTGAYPQIATSRHGHVALVTPGGSGVVRSVDVTKQSSGNIITGSTLTAGLVTVTVDTINCPPGIPQLPPMGTQTTATCPLNLMPGNAGSVLIAGLIPTNSANLSLFNGIFSVNVTSSSTFTYVVNSTASDNASPPPKDPNNPAQIATALYGQPDQIYPISGTQQGIAINPITNTAAIADPNAASGQQIDLLNSLDQSISSLNFSAGCTFFTTTCSGGPELGTAEVAWQPYTNALVSYNPTRNELSVSDPVGLKRYALITALTGSGTATLNNKSTPPLQNGTTTNSLNLFGGLAVDPVTNQAFVVKSGSHDIDIVDLGSFFKGTPIKSAHINELVVPSAPPALLGCPQSAGGSPIVSGIPGIGVVFPQGTLTSTTDLCGVQVFGSGFLSGGSGTTNVRLDGTAIPSTNVNVVSPRQLYITIPSSFLAVPHKYALDVLTSGGSGPNAQSNATDFYVVQAVDMSTVCAGTNGNPANPQPTSVAIADQVANGPFSPIAVVSNAGCNSISVIDINPTITGTPQLNPNFGQFITKSIGVGANPQGIAISQRRGLAVVANNGAATASIIDLTSNPPKQPIVPDVSTGTNPTGVAINEATDSAIVANNGSNTITMLNFGVLFPPSGTTAPTTLTPTSIGGIQSPIAVAIDPDRGTNNQGIAVVTSLQLQSGQAPLGALAVVEIGLQTPTISNTIPSGSVTATPTGIVFDPFAATNTASPGVFYANSSGSNVITAFNPDAGGGSSVNVGINPTSLAVNPQTGAILTSNSASNTISIVDTLSSPLKTRQTFGIPGSPTFGVAVDQFTNLAVIVDQANNRVLLFPMPN